MDGVYDANKKQSVKILVTGANGYIGSRAARYLVDCGYNVYGLVRSSIPIDNDGVNYIHGYFGNQNDITDILSKYKPDFVLHCAGVTPHKDVKDSDYFEVNVEASLTLLRTIEKMPFECGLINVSTIGVYGTPIHDNGMVCEDDDCQPNSLYAQSKHDFESILNKETNISFINIRVANIPGRDAFINYVLKHESVNFFGKDAYIRDYIHLDDLCDLFDKSIRYLMVDKAKMTVNAGSGVGYSFRDIVDGLEQKTGKLIKRSYHDTKSGDVIKIICDISSAKQKLGWSPRHTNIEEIIDYAVCHAQL